jgi:hypothetical protein
MLSLSFISLFFAFLPVVTRSEGQVAVLDGKGQMRSLEQITGILMRRMKETAENNLGKEV